MMYYISGCGSVYILTYSALFYQLHIITVHTLSQYTCVRDGKIGKDELKYDSLSKAANYIVKKRLLGHVRLKCFVELNNTKSATIAEVNGEEI